MQPSSTKGPVRQKSPFLSAVVGLPSEFTLNLFNLSWEQLSSSPSQHFAGYLDFFPLLPLDIFVLRVCTYVCVWIWNPPPTPESQPGENQVSVCSAHYWCRCLEPRPDSGGTSKQFWGSQWITTSHPHPPHLLMAFLIINHQCFSNLMLSFDLFFSARKTVIAKALDKQLGVCCPFSLPSKQWWDSSLVLALIGRRVGLAVLSLLVVPKCQR